MTQSVLVLGGGIIGLSCAFEAARRGFKVTLAEPGKLGGQASGAAAGMLAPFTENGEQPDSFFRLCLSSLKLYPEWVRAVEECSGLAVEWEQSGSLNVFQHEADVLPAEGRMRWQNDWGARAELVDPAALRKLEPGLSHEAAGAVFIPEESHVYAPKLVDALAAACRRLGVTILEHAGEIGAINVGLANPIRGDRVVICSGAWTTSYEDILGISIPIHPIRGQICSFDSPEGILRHMVFSSQAYWVGKRNGRIVCGASEDVAGYETAVTDKGIGRLTRATDRWLPRLQGIKPAHSWAGLRPATRDGLPLIGPITRDGEWIMAAGHYRNGILLSPVTAHLVADMLEGSLDAKRQAAVAPFAPGRFTSR
ncbi:glycine oxidase ThiO [Paenibacillus sp. LHD-117]|uniref:glycine oxidase ThiO n=1 Tax=Paenibacillus sp. LHD-117 TaxID=3071412 RepID=UPI0027DF1195|nr:glycine oxidase ThiO [Paenibacillus sp. LHD-117]MDQ6418328.1 glycine oxidase ThiO [Paenibacillus sp. LHD-117]